MGSPKHVAIILDGNRRFAKRLMLEPWKGHDYGARKIEALLDYAKDYGINEITLYCLSCENIKSRPKDELEYLFKLFKKEFKDIDREEIEGNKIKIRFIGNLDLLPEDLKEQCLRLEEETSENNNFAVNFCIAYGGRQEIVEAVRRILKNKVDVDDVNEGVVEENLLLQSEPDIVIRTGGEKRSSNFLPWQTTYSEWFYLDKFWPEFEREDLVECIEEFKKRKRRFGG